MTYPGQGRPFFPPNPEPETRTMNAKRIDNHNMTPDETFDAIFGEGASARADAVDAAFRRAKEEDGIDYERLGLTTLGQLEQMRAERRKSS